MLLYAFISPSFFSRHVIYLFISVWMFLTSASCPSNSLYPTGLRALFVLMWVLRHFVQTLCCISDMNQHLYFAWEKHIFHFSDFLFCSSLTPALFFQRPMELGAEDWVWSCTHTPTQAKDRAMVSSHSWRFVSPGAMLMLLAQWLHWVLKFSWLKKMQETVTAS